MLAKTLTNGVHPRYNSLHTHHGLAQEPQTAQRARRLRNSILAVGSISMLRVLLSSNRKKVVFYRECEGTDLIRSFSTTASTKTINHDNMKTIKTFSHVLLINLVGVYCQEVPTASPVPSYSPSSALSDKPSLRAPSNVPSNAPSSSLVTPTDNSIRDSLSDAYGSLQDACS